MEPSHGNEGVCLAVVPFSNHSGREDLDYFGLGLVEELIVDLSYFSGLNLISSYTAKLLVNGDGELAAAKKRRHLMERDRRCSILFYHQNE